MLCVLCKRVLWIHFDGSEVFFVDQCLLPKILIIQQVLVC